MPMHPSEQRFVYVKDVSRLVHSGISTEGTATFISWSKLYSVDQTTGLLKQQDPVVNGSFDVTCFVRLATVSAIVLPGANTHCSTKNSSGSTARCNKKIATPETTLLFQKNVLLSAV